MGKASKKPNRSASDRNKLVSGNNSVKKQKTNNFKSKSRIEKTTNLSNKIKQRHKNKGKHGSANFLDPVATKVNSVKDNSTTSSNTISQVQSEGYKNKRNKKFKKHIKKIISEGPSKEKTEIQKSVKNGKQTKGKFRAIDKIGKMKVMPTNKVREQEKDHNESKVSVEEKNDGSQKKPITRRLDIKRLEEMLVLQQKQTKKEKKGTKPQSLRDRMMAKLRASRFRYLNETLYKNQSSESKKYFKEDPDAFTAYHDGYKQQIDQWPLNPLDVVISSIEKMPKSHIIADFGCGEARLASSVAHKVHSFDFVALNEKVKACDMAHTPLLTGSVHVVVFCLSLMGSNLSDYIIEANRVLKNDGILKIAEVESRFHQVEDFIKVLGDYGFQNTWKDLSHNLFYFLDFKKEKDITGKRSKLPPISLKSCLYKKR